VIHEKHTPCPDCGGRGVVDAHETGDCNGGPCRHCNGTGVEPESKVIRFPGTKGKKAKAAEPAPITTKLQTPEGKQIELNEAQTKAFQAILSGMAFVFVGIKPSEKGADFFTSLHGPKEDLRNAHNYIAEVIDRLYEREGL
jgi:DnaJ-class molecular chaperone